MEDISLLKQSLPYIQRFKGTTFVVKLGGEAMRNVAITEQYQFITWAVSFVKGIIPLGGLVQGTMDFRARGTRIGTGASVRDESIPPPPSSTGTTTTDPSVGY